MISTNDMLHTKLEEQISLNAGLKNII